MSCLSSLDWQKQDIIYMLVKFILLDDGFNVNVFSRSCMG